MTTPKYDFDVDLANKNNSHTRMIDLIGSNKRVLEIGCATGYMSRVLRDRGCEVVGLEIDAASAELAREHCDEVIVGDVEQLDLAGVLGGEGFEVVTFGDVLEHLRDPLGTLRSVRPLLRPEGAVVASIPNISHGDVRLSLLKGRFDYQDTGLLDETHLRFFTREGIQRLFRDAGFALMRTERTTLPLFGTEIPLRAEDFPEDVIAQVTQDAESTTYQFVVQAVLDNAAHAVHELHEREQAQRNEIADLADQLKRVSAEAKYLTHELESSHQETARLTRALSETQAELAKQLDRWKRLEGRRSVRLYVAVKRAVRRLRAP